MLSAGTCIIAADQAGNGVYVRAETVAQYFKIDKHSQEIEFDPPEDRPWSENQFEIIATADSGLPVTLKSSTLMVCSVVGRTVLLHGIGTCRIVATQAGNHFFDAKTEVIAFQVTNPDEPKPVEPEPGEPEPESGTTGVKGAKKKKEGKGM